MVQYRDGSVMAQLGSPDMRTPIACALAWPERIEAGVASLDFFSMGSLTFERPDLQRFPCLGLAFASLQSGGDAPAVLNAANEVAVAAFLDGRLRFVDIAKVVEATLAGVSLSASNSLAALLDKDGEARRFAANKVSASPYAPSNVAIPSGAISPIPLGGYVRMLDEREMEVPAEERHLAFNNQHVLKRMAIVVAGPLANLILAVVFYWAVIAGGMVQLLPQVGTVLTPSLAATAGFQPGDQVLSVNQQPVADWQQLRLALVDAAGSGDVPIRVQVKTSQGATLLRSIDPAQADEDALKALEQGNPGLMPMRYLSAIGGVEEG
uniref:PDZ domain-containing protein n=1 Tax=Anopheles coluzzii TaxID=1518534 RepID=A0A8W7P2H0_ANOCL